MRKATTGRSSGAKGAGQKRQAPARPPATLRGRTSGAGESSRGGRTSPKRGPGGEVRATVLVADLSGLAPLARSSEPGRVGAILREFFAATTDVAVGHRALIDRPAGAALMLLYGVPRSRRDDAARALRTAFDLQHSFLSLRNVWLARGWAATRSLGLSIGIATDLVVMASVEKSGGVVSAPLGEAVERAARLCRGASMGESLIDEATYGSVRPLMEGEARFTSRESLRGGERFSGYRAERRRAGLRLVAPRRAVDPVCQVRIERSAALRRQIDGRTVYFCSERCAERFAARSETFGG